MEYVANNNIGFTCSRCKKQIPIPCHFYTVQKCAMEQKGLYQVIERKVDLFCCECMEKNHELV